MAIVAKADNSNFTPAPEGQWRAVCCDVVDMGMIKTEWQGKPRETHKIRIVFQIEVLNDELTPPKPFIVSQMFTLSLSEKANLRKFLESWRGTPFNTEQLKDGFDVEKLIGANAILQVVNVDKGEKTYANIQAIMKLMKGMEALKVDGYIRVQDRVESGAQDDDPPPHEDEDLEGLPF